jgi:hypothetical protein
MSEWEIIGPAPAQESEWEIIGPAPQQSAKEPWYEAPWIAGSVPAFNRAIEETTHGILQPLLESGYLGENIKRGSKNVARERSERYFQAQQKHPRSAMLGNILGNIAINLPGSVAGGVTTAQTLSKAPKFLQYLSGILGGGIGGGLQGASQYVNPEDSRLKNALMGAGMGSIFGGIPLGYSAGKAINKAYPAEKVAKRIISDRDMIKNQYSDAYKSLFKEAQSSGVNSLKVPKLNANAIKQNTTSKEFSAIEKFIANPTLETAHRAQSDLGRTIRRLEKTHEGVGLNTSQQEALEAALGAQKKIRGSMYQGFLKKGTPELAEKYGELTRGYAKEVLPYTKNKPINTFRKGELTEKDLLNALSKDKKFRKQLGEKYPELGTRQYFKHALSGAAGLGTAAAGYEALHLLGLIK